MEYVIEFVFWGYNQLPAYAPIRDGFLARASTPPGAAAMFLIAVLGLTLLKQHCYGPTGRGRRPPGPWIVVPFIGETAQLLRRGPLEYFLKRYHKYGPIFRTHLLGEPIYVLGDFSVTRAMLRDYSASMHVPGTTFCKLVTDTSHIHEEKLHQPWRRHMLTALGPSAVEQYYPKVQVIINEHLAEWAVGLKVAWFQAAQNITMDFAVNVVLGINFKVPRTRQWAKEQFGLVNRGLNSLPVNLPGTHLSIALSARQMLKDGLRRDLKEDIIAIKRAYERSPDGAKLEATNLLEAQVYSMLPAKELSYARVFDRVAGSVVAAADATKHIMFATVVLVGSVPRVFEKLREEQRQMISEHGPSSLTYRNVNSLPYLDAAVKEAMRLLPASNGGFRTLLRHFKSGQYVIPEGAKVWYSSHLLHALDPAMMHEASLPKSGVPLHMDASAAHVNESFRPERWLVENEGSKPQQYITFGDGLHLCPGMGLAYSEVKLLLVNLLRRFEWHMEDPDWLAKCTQRFPGLQPAPGTDLIDFISKPL